MENEKLFLQIDSIQRTKLKLNEIQSLDTAQTLTLQNTFSRRGEGNNEGEIQKLFENILRSLNSLCPQKPLMFTLYTLEFVAFMLSKMMHF